MKEVRFLQFTELDETAAVVGKVYLAQDKIVAIREEEDHTTRITLVGGEELLIKEMLPQVFTTNNGRFWCEGVPVTECTAVAWYVHRGIPLPKEHALITKKEIKEYTEEGYHDFDGEWA